MNKKKIFAFVCAAAMMTAVFSGCTKNNGNEESTAQTSESDYSTDTRPIEEGDDYAINKINNKTQGDTLPGGYKLQDYREEQQGKLYSNGKSRIIIRAYNYNEDLQDMAIWADQACAVISVGNSMNFACDTVFQDPENVKVCGFDGIKYDYDIIQNEFVRDENDPNATPEKREIERFKARVYYFYSEQDAYAVMFDTMEADWNEQIALFEEFVADLEVTKTEY